MRQEQSSQPQVKTDLEQQLRCCCYGPGYKRYFIAVLCSLGLTVVIGMRAEMVAIMGYLERKSNSNSSDYTSLMDTAGGSKFQPSAHIEMPWRNAANDLIENSLFIGYFLASPLGGYLTVHHDSSLLLGCSVALTCGLNFFLPLVTQIAADISVNIAIIVLFRLLQGLAEGCLVPAVFGAMRHWSPASERSSLLCFAVIGVSMGPLIGLPVSQEVETAWGWAVVFYIYANSGLVWCVFWWRMVDEKPAKDLHLSRRESNYLESTIGAKVLRADRRIPIPWKSIFTCKPVYAIFITYAADDWTFQISSVCMQTYYHQMYATDVSTTIFLLSFPFLARSLFVLIGGLLADYLKLRTSLSWTAIRKIFAGLGFGLKAVFFVALGFANDAVFATVMLSLALGFSGLAVAGYAVNVMELAPIFCGLVMGFASSISTITGMMSTVVATIIVQPSEDKERVRLEWLIALSCAAVTQLMACVAYMLFASAEEQPWSASTADEIDARRHANNDTAVTTPSSSPQGRKSPSIGGDSFSDSVGSFY